MPLATPGLPDVMLSHGALLTPPHGQPVVAVTPMVPDPPAVVGDAPVGLSVYVQPGDAVKRARIAS